MRPIRVGAVMTGDPETVAADDTLQAAAEKMRARAIGFLPVFAGERPVGVVTDRDITVRAIARGADPNRTAVAEVMTPLVFSCNQDDDLEDAARIMEAKAVRRLLVVDHERRLVGVLSVDDVARVAGDEELAGEIVGRAAPPERLRP